MIVILSTLAMFTPVFSGYVLGFLMLLMALFNYFSRETDGNIEIRKKFQRSLLPISNGALIFWTAILLAAFLAAATTPSIDSKALRQALGNFTVKYVVLWFIYLTFWWRLAAVKNLWRVFTFSYAIVAVIHLGYCVIQRQYGVDWGHGFGSVLGSNRFAYGVYRISGFVGHPLTLGYCQVLALIASLHFFLKAENHSEKIAWLAAVLSPAVVLLLSGSRGPQAVTLVGILVSVPLSSFRKYRRLLALLSLTLMLLGWQFGIFSRFLEIFTAGSGGDLRGIHWRVHWNIFMDHPLVGIGPGTFRSAISAYYFSFGADDNIKLAHNAFLQFAAEYGLIGLVGVGVWLSSWYRVASNSCDSKRAFWSLLTVTVFGGLTQNNLQDSAFVYALTIWTMILAAHEVLRNGYPATEPKIDNLLTREGGASS